MSEPEIVKALYWVGTECEPGFAQEWTAFIRSTKNGKGAEDFCQEWFNKKGEKTKPCRLWYCNQAVKELIASPEGFGSELAIALMLFTTVAVELEPCDLDSLTEYLPYVEFSLRLTHKKISLGKAVIQVGPTHRQRCYKAFFVGSTARNLYEKDEIIKYLD